MTNAAPKHILVVDDLPDNRGLLVQFLEDSYRVSEAATGLAAMAVIATDGPDLILLDLAMPVMDGYEVLASLRARQGPHLPVIVVTADYEREARLRALEAGAHEFLTKPIDPDELHARVRTLLALKAAQDEITARNEQLEALVAERTRELVREKAQVERIVNGTPAAIAFLDHGLVFRRVNPAWESLTGTSAERTLGRHLSEVLTSSCEPRLEALLSRAMSNARSFRRAAFPLPRVGKGPAEERYWDLACEPVAGERADVEGVLLMAIDVTERVQRERREREQLEHTLALERMKSDFVAVVSHELRTPLNFILGFTEILEADLADSLSPDQRGYLAGIMEGSTRLAALVNDVIAVNSIAGGCFSLQIAEECFPPLVEQAVASLKAAADARGLRVETDVVVAHPVPVDARHIVDVMARLLDNAAKFSAEGGDVRLEVRVRGDALIAEVSDSGPGIQEADLPRLFAPFDQLDMSSTRPANGSGLGLYIARCIVEAHGGEIGVVSTPGKGSTFWFSVPLAAKRPAAASRKAG